MIKEIQQLLKLSKLYTGSIDGQFGLESLRALQKMPEAVTKTLQTMLKNGCYYQGNIDGIFGPQCYKALNSLIPAPVLTAEKLKKIYPGASTRFISEINKQAATWDITTKAQFCMFLANILVESTGFNDKDLRENFNYKPENLHATFKKYIHSVTQARALLAKGPEAVANHVYGGRLGNGVANGDGWRYRGGGLIQTTGRYNYSVTGKGINEDLVNFPHRIAEPDIAIKSAFYYWKSRNCGYHADRMEVKLCRKAVNGGTNGLDEVNEYFLRAWAYLF